MNLSGNMTRQVESPKMPVDDSHPHIANIGTMIEEMEIKMRNSLQEIYFGKTKDIVNDLRSMKSTKETSAQDAVAKELASKLKTK